MKEYLMNQYKEACSMVVYFTDQPGTLAKQTLWEYTGAKMAIGNVLTEQGFMAKKELSTFDYDCTKESMIIKAQREMKLQGIA